MSMCVFKLACFHCETTVVLYVCSQSRGCYYRDGRPRAALECLANMYSNRSSSHLPDLCTNMKGSVQYLLSGAVSHNSYCTVSVLHSRITGTNVNQGSFKQAYILYSIVNLYWYVWILCRCCSISSDGDKAESDFLFTFQCLIVASLGHPSSA